MVPRIFSSVALVLLISGAAFAGHLLGPDGAEMVNGFKVCPSSIVCEPSEPAEVFGVTWYVNGVSVGWVTEAPYTYSSSEALADVTFACVASDNAGDWKETVEVTGSFDCGTTPDIAPVVPVETPAPVTAPAAAPVTNWRNCVTMPASTYVNTPANNHWKKHGTAMVYRANINDKHKTFPPGTDPLVYKFTVPVASVYAITMDSTTTLVTDYNDCWIKFTPGITLRKILDGVQWPLRVGLTGSVKAYQNTAKRSRAAYSIDGHYHSFETTDVLEPGVEYTLIVEGRSPKFMLHGIIMFPCEGETCWHQSAHHATYRNQCNV